MNFVGVPRECSFQASQDGVHKPRVTSHVACVHSSVHAAGYDRLVCVAKDTTQYQDSCLSPMPRNIGYFGFREF